MRIGALEKRLGFDIDGGLCRARRQLSGSAAGELLDDVDVLHSEFSNVIIHKTYGDPTFNQRCLELFKKLGPYLWPNEGSFQRREAVSSRGWLAESENLNEELRSEYPQDRFYDNLDDRE